MKILELNKAVNKLLILCSLSVWVSYNRSSFGLKTNAEFPRFYPGDDWRPTNRQSGAHFSAIFPSGLGLEENALTLSHLLLC